MSGVIVVGIDAHDPSRDAAALGAALAGAAGAELVLVHVHPIDPFADALAYRADGEDPLRAEAEALLRRAAEAAAPLAPRTLTIAAASAVGGLHRVAAREGAELLVVGSSHRGRLGRTLLGGHTERALAGAPCPVAVAPRGLAGSGWSPRQVVAAFDGSDEAHEALALARRLAARAGARLKLVGVAVGPLDRWEYQYTPDWREVEQRREAELRDRLRDEAGEGADVELRLGDAAEQLLDVAAEADLLVLGSRGYGPVRRVLLGSVSGRVVRDAPCPVIVVPRSATAEEHDAGDASG
ncbi:MAG: universal stress protein [Solirubrobacteraceae bacterium]|nr:universal stress protein [Solirubrobacteraceae bacterium]